VNQWTKAYTGKTTNC